jgi:hypothetical protein
MVHKRATYGYRRVWAKLILDENVDIHHKRVKRIMRDADCGCCFVKGKSLLTPESMKGKWRSNKAIRDGAQTGWCYLVKTLKRNYAKLANRSDFKKIWLNYKSF